MLIHHRVKPATQKAIGIWITIGFSAIHLFSSATTFPRVQSSKNVSPWQKLA